MAHHDLLLYFSPTCPYCTRVLNYLRENGIDIPTKNVRESSEVNEQFRRASGGTQVPCLMIDGKPMLESLEIIDWLKENVADESE